MDHVRYANGEIPQDGWGGFEAYMKKKAAKLASQFQLDAGKCDKNGTSSIFKGVSIYVNGYTDPPAEKLKRLMMMHGGRFIYYPTKANTTHIIASNLAYTKIKELKNEKVVRPAWITDSLKAGKLLPHAPYILYRPKASNQTLHRFADKKLSRLDRVQHATESKGEASSLITNPESVSRNVTSEGYYPSSDHKREKVSKSPTEEETDIARTTDSKPDRCDDVTDTVRKGDTFPAPVIHEGDIPSEKFATHELKRVDRSSSEKLERKEGTKTIVSHTGPVNATASPSSNEKSPKLKTEECKIDDNSEDITDPPEFGKLYFPKSTDPNFLPSFYRHSSFYHLTTWRAEHRLFVKELHRNSDGTFPSKQKLIAMYGKTESTLTRKS
ncbi:putative DNA repair protein [Apostichopus japonicus]|uniref:Putative DNA repair protein n=1 Tax=Stichopus japonicus TaxID=307972 RepID=A0A2G8KT85_STIJA|nr:putative DNA repair protein [Apostichopus japonicus]